MKFSRDSFQDKLVEKKPAGPDPDPDPDPHPDPDPDLLL